MSADSRIPVSRCNYAVVVGLFGFDRATNFYRYDPEFDAVDDRPIERRVHLLTPADRRLLDEGEP